MLTKGTYRVSGVILIRTSGVVLRGEGQDGNTGTIIVGIGTGQMDGLGVVVFKSPMSFEPMIESGTTQQITSGIVPVGSRTFEVENASMYNVGDRLIIQHPATDAWLKAIRYGDTAGDEVPWVPLQGDLTMKFQGTVAAVVDNKIKLDSPVYSELRRSLSQANVSRHSGIGVLSECGIENIQVVSKNEDSIDLQNESHRRDCVHFINVRDCWAVSTTTSGFVQSGIRFTNSIRSTVLDCSAIDPLSKIEGGRRYNFRVENDCHDILFKRCTASKGRHDFVSNGTAKTSGIVFTQCSASGSYGASENHRRWGSSILWDKIAFTYPHSTLTMTLGLGYNRGSAGTSHGWTGSGMVGWNVIGKKIVVQKPPLGQNYAIGCKAIVDNKGPYLFPIGFVEGTGQTLSISSLYEAQLAERMTYGSGPADMPAMLQVTTRAELSWIDIALDETSYVIERSSNDGATYSSLASLPANSISYTDSMAIAGAIYTYRVKAVNTFSSSAYSNIDVQHQRRHYGQLHQRRRLVHQHQSPLHRSQHQSPLQPTTLHPTSRNPTTLKPSSLKPTSRMPSSLKPTSPKPSTPKPITQRPTTSKPTTTKPTTISPTTKPASAPPTVHPTSAVPTSNPSLSIIPINSTKYQSLPFTLF